MTSTSETDLAQKLETNGLQTLTTNKDAADRIKIQANEAFKGKTSLFLSKLFISI